MSKPKRQKAFLIRNHAGFKLKADSQDIPAEAEPTIQTGSGQRGCSDNTVSANYRDCGFSGVLARFDKREDLYKALSKVIKV